MANYRELQHLVKEGIEGGLIRKKMTLDELAEAYRECTKGMGMRPRGHNFGEDAWGHGGRSNETKIAFYRECAKQVYGLPAWPEESSLKDIRRAQELGVTVEDLPFVKEAVKVSELANYLKVCALQKKKHLPLRFFLDLVAAGVREVENFQETKFFFGDLYNLGCTYSITGTRVVEVLKRMEVYGDLCMFKDHLQTMHLEGDELRAHYLKYYPHVYALYQAGVISAKFGVRYRGQLGSDWHQFGKITDNPLWDRQPKFTALALYRGLTPQQVAKDHCSDGIDLTRKEATEWLATEVNRYGDKITPSQFLCDKLGIDRRVLRKFRHCSRALLIWYDRKKDLPSMSKVRTVYGPGGQSRTFCYNDILDEITEEDLGAAGASLGEKLNANPERVFDAASKRLEALYLSQLGSSVELPVFPGEKKPVDGISQLCYSDELINEGKRQDHCVGGYIKACLKKKSYVFTVSTAAGRSTFEVCKDNGYYLAQHYGAGNKAAPEANVELVERWCQLNGVRYKNRNQLRYAA